MAKNNYKKTLKAFIFALLLPFAFVAGSANAQDAGSNSSITSTYIDKKIEGIIKYPIQTSGDNLEYVHLWYKQMLGGFVFAPWQKMQIDNENYKPGERTLLANALGFTNILSIIICLIVTYYMIIGGAINTAAEGQVLGKNWNTPWLMIRTAVGFMLITPLQVIGGMTLSLAQVGVIWLLMIGSNAGSLLWYYSIDQMQEGTRIVQPNIELGRHKVAEIMKMVMCADASVRVRSMADVTVLRDGFGRELKKQQDSNALPLVEAISIHYAKPYIQAKNDGIKDGKQKQKIVITREKSTLEGVYAESKAKIRFRQLGDKPLPPAKTDSIHSISFGYQGQCGNISFRSDIAKDSKSYLPGAADTVQATNYKSAAMKQGSNAYARKIIEIVNILIEANSKLQASANFSIETLRSGSEVRIDDYKPSSKRLGYSDLSQFMSFDGYKSCLLSKCNNNASKHLYEKLNEAQKLFDKAADIYENEIVDQVHKAVTSGGNSKLLDQLYAKMKYGGWPAAGLWFYEISALPGMSYNVINNVHTSIVSEPPSFCFKSGESGSNNCHDMQNEANAGYQIASVLLRESLTPGDGESTTGSTLDHMHAPCSALGSCSSGSGNTDRLAIAIARETLEFLSNSPVNVNPFSSGTATAENNLSSPFLFASELGHTMNFMAQSAVGGAILAVSIRDYIEGFDAEENRTIVDEIKSLSGVEKVLHAFFGLPKAIAMNTLSFGGGLLMLIAMSAVSSGFLLAYVIPFMPVMTWIMMMAGYMLTTVEAIAAAPLAVVLLFTPEGQGISGSRFERALNLVSMAVLRPSFMVLGMLAGLTVSFVAFTMMNIFFFTAAEYLLSGTIFDVFAVIILYVSATFQMCKLMVSTMHDLPDRIGEWFAGGVSRQFGESRISDNAENTMATLGNKMDALPKLFENIQKGNVEKSVKD